jgi:predicted HicB family RNase H-like nuclease
VFVTESQKLIVVEPEAHRQAKARAALENKSIKRWVSKLILEHTNLGQTSETEDEGN